MVIKKILACTIRYNQNILKQLSQIVKSYINFTRSERMGLIVLCTILFILIVVRLSISIWVHPKLETDKENKLRIAWAAFKRNETYRKPEEEITENKNDYEDAFDDNPLPMPAIIGINTADSATLVRLKGIGPAIASKIILRRNTKGKFKNINDLKELYGFSEQTFLILKQHLKID